MTRFLGTIFLTAILIFPVLSGQTLGSPLTKTEVSGDRLAEFARCITRKGWTLYSSFTCPACRAQQKLFGPAKDHLKIVECNPHAPDTQVELCLKRNIRYTPTWLLIENDAEVRRKKGYQDLGALSSLTGCPL